MTTRYPLCYPHLFIIENYSIIKKRCTACYRNKTGISLKFLIQDKDILYPVTTHDMPRKPKKVELSPRLKFGVDRARTPNQILKISAVVCLVLAIGLTANDIRLLYSSKTTNYTGKVLGASDTRTVTVPDVQFIQYTVQKGDTLFDVSQKFNITWSTLATVNNIQSPFVLKPGEILKIPKQ